MHLVFKILVISILLKCILEVSYNAGAPYEIITRTLNTPVSCWFIPHFCVCVFADGRVEEENAATKHAITVLSSADLRGFLVVPFTKAKARPKPAGFLVRWSQGQMSPLGFS